MPYIDKTTFRGTGAGGLRVSPQMQRLVDKPGFLSEDAGGQALRTMHTQGSLNFNPLDLTYFGFCCVMGHLDDVKTMVESKEAPDLKGWATPYKIGYVALVVLGFHRVRPAAGTRNASLQHLETLQFLLSEGAPADVPDIVGQTALHHLFMVPPVRADFTRTLLDGGANADYQNRFGEPPIQYAFVAESISSIDLLLQRGASLDIVNANNVTVRAAAVHAGAQVAAAVERWVRRHAGAPPLPLEETKTCEFCRATSDQPLRCCSRCHIVRYCSQECQRTDWPQHKRLCEPFTPENSVTVKPFYDSSAQLQPLAPLSRAWVGLPDQTPIPEAHRRHAHVPMGPKGVVIKVQVPFDNGGRNPVMVYTRKRDLVCSVRYQDMPAAYDRLRNAVRTHGVEGAKAYFVAQLKDENELVIKISQVLAVQPF
ncbi:hypothetical protein FISHEDRAFT_52392 [Fistulina hepatica ATCC 64428]|nr:hypothetical protein FISHEDRAFT_52392 [Fistulina hepatica ATCC 64428]